MRRVFQYRDLPFFWTMLLALSLLPFFSAVAEEGYFYQGEMQNSFYRNSCAQIFDDIRNGKGADIGGVVRLLKNINVDYRLRDYDNAINPKTRQVYVGYDDLLKEVEANKQEIYCKIELAQYMRGKPEFAGPVFDQLLDDAFTKLSETYTEASRSLNAGDFERAIYAFDLIAPYADSYRLFLLAGDKQMEESGALAPTVADEMLAPAEAGDLSAEQKLGPIGLAVKATEKKLTNAFGDTSTKSPGPIALAARVGAITSALAAGE